MQHPSIQFPVSGFPWGYSCRNHTWAYLESSGAAITGIDDFLLRVTGKLKVNVIREEGESIRKGDIIAEVSQNGRKLRIASPVSGRISDVNSYLTEDMLLSDPYGAGWICKIKPSHWKAETQGLFLAGETEDWLKRELGRLRDLVAVFMAGQAPGKALPVLQDGGELSSAPLADLPVAAWSEFEKSFLTLEAENE